MASSRFKTEYGSTDGAASTKGDEEQPSVVLLDLDAPEWGKPIERSKQVLGVFGSVAIFMNAIIGPGFLSLPKLYNDSGVLMPTTLLLLGFWIAVLSTIVRSEAVALMPGNSGYTRIVEFCDPALKFVGYKTFYLCHVLFYVASMATVVASIVLVSEALDVLIAHVFGKTYAFIVSGQNSMSFIAWNMQQNCRKGNVCKPFFTGHEVRSQCLVSLGYAATFCLLFPVSTDLLSEGMKLQYASLAAMAVAVPIFMTKDLIKIIVDGARTIAVFEGGGRALDASGVVLFNLMFGIFVSTWLAEKRPDVSVDSVVKKSSAASCAVMIAYGLLGAVSARKVAVNGLFGETEQGGSPVTLCAAILFGIFVIASGVPVACVQARHNLISSPIVLVSDSFATHLTVTLPWATAWLFTSPIVYKALLNYVGLFVVSWLALWMPFFLILARYDPLPSSENSSPLEYLRWYCRQLTAPPDFQLRTFLAPLPYFLMPYSRRIYAAMLLLIAAWIVACLASYVIYATIFVASGAGVE